MNIKEDKFIDKFCEINEDSAVVENFKEIEFNVFLEELTTNLNKNQKQIVKFFAWDFSDTEISLKVGVSRQYVNRLRRNLKKELIKSLK